MRQQFIEEIHHAMKPATLIGIVLIVVGIIGFAVGGFTFSHEKKDVDLGPLQVSHEQKSTVPIPPILSTIALVGGIALVAVGVRKS
jgi:uncharacterized membrane protein YidH (DUF202 family)